MTVPKGNGTGIDNVVTALFLGGSRHREPDILNVRNLRICYWMLSICTIGHGFNDEFVFAFEVRIDHDPDVFGERVPRASDDLQNLGIQSRKCCVIIAEIITSESQIGQFTGRV